MKVAITGHMQLPAAAVPTLRTKLTEYLSEVQSQHQSLSGISCLAPGADQLFAEVCYELNIAYEAILPCTDYSTVIQDEAKVAAFYSALERASSMQRLDFAEGSSKVYWEASQLMVQKADVVIAIWDELPARGHGGTGDVVQLAKVAGKAILILNPETINSTEAQPKKTLWELIKEVLDRLPVPKTINEEDD